MSGSTDDEKNEASKHMPLDLARTQVTTVKTAEGKAPLVMSGQHLRGMRVLSQTASSGAVQTTSSTPAIITTNILPSPILKQETSTGRTQIANIINTAQATSGVALQRPTQITIATTLPVVAQNIPSGTTYHVPRGPAVVANLAAPRSNVGSALRAPMVVAAQTTGQTHAFVRPPRTPSPAQGTAWLTTSSTNGSQIKGAPTVLSSPVRGATVTGLVGTGVKPQLVARTQPVTQTIRPTTAILHSAIAMPQGTQIHAFKSGQTATGIQALGNTVTIAQVLPSRTQPLVYSAGTTAHFTASPRVTVANTVATARQAATPRPLNQVTTARLSVPATQQQARLVAPQATVLAAGTRLSSVGTTQQPAILGTTTARLVPTTQPNVSLGRLSVTVANTAQVTTSNILGQTRISALSLHPLVAVGGGSQARNLQTQGAKVITQTTQATAILAQMPVKGTQAITTTTSRTISVQPGTIVAQRQAAVVTTQAIPIAKVIPQGDNQTAGTATNVFIHASVASVPRRSSPGPTTSISQQASSVVSTTTIPTYTIANNAYFYDTSSNYSVARSFSQQQNSFATLSQASQQIRTSGLGAQVHGIVTGQQMRFNPVMVVEQNRTPFTQDTNQEAPAMQQQQAAPPKITSSPRPSILRKRDHEGSPLKVAKNLTPVLSSLPPAPPSPPSRPDSRGNGHSSGGSTTISATSSPGLAEGNEDSIPHAPMNIKEEEDVTRPPVEMSPRKKPRKQQLTGNDLTEKNGDMQFISESTIKKEREDSDGNNSDDTRDGPPDPKRVATVRKPASASLLNSYRQNWKANHNHYLRYSDVRPKDERRPTIMDLANQYRVLDKVNGWKIHHLSTQMEDLADQEANVYNQLTELLKCTESEEGSNFAKDVDMINELIKGNLQRIKIINDGMIEAKSQIMKIFNHKMHVTDIISRCASKRNFKKREKP